MPQSNLIVSGLFAEETGAMGIKGTKNGDLGKTWNESHFQILKGKSQFRFVLSSFQGRIRTSG